MHKLIEIPIYALDKNTLLTRYEKYVEALRCKISTKNIGVQSYSGLYFSGL